MGKPRYQLLICDGPSCGVQHGSERFVDAAERAVSEGGAQEGCATVCSFTCFGRCEDGPNVFVRALAPEDDPYAEPGFEAFETQRGFYPGLDDAKLQRVLEEHIGRDAPVDELMDEF